MTLLAGSAAGTAPPSLLHSKSGSPRDCHARVVNVAVPAVSAMIEYWRWWCVEPSPVMLAQRSAVCGSTCPLAVARRPAHCQFQDPATAILTIHHLPMLLESGGAADGIVIFTFNPAVTFMSISVCSGVPAQQIVSRPRIRLIQGVKAVAPLLASLSDPRQMRWLPWRFNWADRRRPESYLDPDVDHVSRGWPSCRTDWWPVEWNSWLPTLPMGPGRPVMRTSLSSMPSTVASGWLSDANDDAAGQSGCGSRLGSEDQRIC